MTTMPNILTVDVEEWFHGHNYLSAVPPERWGDQPSRVEVGTVRCLELLARHGVRATFFLLGWSAARRPDLVRRIAEAGHEIACHSHAHPLLFRMTRDEFRRDLDLALEALDRAGAGPVRGYRAPSFSLRPPVLDFLEMLRERGLEYDCSLFPIRHPRYGQPRAPRRPFRLPGSPPFVVVPMTTARLLGQNLPFSGGGYLRLLPAAAQGALAAVARRQGVPIVLYVHPWELDGYRPDVPLGRLARLRSQGGQRSTAAKLEAILARGSFQTMGQYVDARLAAGDLPEVDLLGTVVKAVSGTGL